ncbi:MAG: hypothetical protein K0U39_01280 [Alphaproteobacteria bacterium]|nr:hypothetical protein [Alphaproteobacteria bacterium]
MSDITSMNDDEYQIRRVILWAAKTWRMNINDILIMPLAEFEKWCAVSVTDEAQEKN